MKARPAAILVKQEQEICCNYEGRAVTAFFTIVDLTFDDMRDQAAGFYVLEGLACLN
jgi:hypothetical protein